MYWVLHSQQRKDFLRAKQEGFLEVGGNVKLNVLWAVYGYHLIIVREMLIFGVISVQNAECCACSVLCDDQSDVQCAMCMVQYAMCNMQYAMCNVQCAMFKVHCSMCNVQ